MAKAIGDTAGPGEDRPWSNSLGRGRVPGPRLPQQRVFDDVVGPSTQSVHSGTYIDPVTGAVGTPIFTSSTFEFNEHTYGAFDQGHIRDVPIYGRYGSPNQWVVQEKVAALENAESAVVFASGMAAITTTLLALTNRGGHIVTSRDVYGGSYNLLREDMYQLGRDVTFADATSMDAIVAAVRPQTQVLFFETLTNPLLKALPLAELGEYAERNHLLLVVDNTFLTPYCLRPLELGAHVVIHSATKYLGGHSDVTAGLAVGSRKYMDRLWKQMLKFGGSIDAFPCFLLERGLKTLALRMRAHVANADALAAFLAGHPKVRTVHHPSLPDYGYPAIREICRDGFGGMVSFEVAGGDEAALKLLERLTIPQVATSLGGVESLVSLPFNTSHSFLTEAQRRDIGIEPGLVRLSAGVEDTADLIADIDQALNGI
ncbi:Cys/Met metabolism pyridoxal-phosphate-dependent protein [Streptomyces zinciresistens K42]|uniref:homocysteine desulfhydrase n=1 Tax=Streptomyces zinciresistens K42 TaxID=700597 RepID=G2G9D8_9ACTN|nr:aminotransferase class I/II-fold pyridoxal phosphate-dependent enzyme [Streptomyces zinciresistens]EGX59853.1 Cys/Met metabolism pyridoxal-phosphate-dependent protein [Streptomyces zinciresistens K42]